MDKQYFPNIGYKLVNQFLQEFEIAKAKAEKKAAEARVEQETTQEVGECLMWREADQLAAQAKAEKQAAQAKANNEDLDPDPDVTLTCVGETADSLEAQSRPFDDTQQATPKETSHEEGFEIIAPQEAEVTWKEAEEVPKRRIKKPTLSAQEPQAFKEAVVAAEDLGKERLDTGIGTVILTQEAKPNSKKKPRLPLVENRPLHNQSLYKKVSKEYWVLVEGQWTISRHLEQWVAIFGLYHTLLYKYYNFLLTSQHPIALAALKRLPEKYAMPARMQKHSIYSFLEIIYV